MKTVAVEDKREQEKKVVAKMIGIYCKGNKHSKEGLCDACQGLVDYSFQRLDRCPFMETKTFCSNCKVHCYRKDMREKIKTVMRFSGPRMLLHHPILTIRHVFETKKHSRKRNEQ